MRFVFAFMVTCATYGLIMLHLDLTLPSLSPDMVGYSPTVVVMMILWTASATLFGGAIYKILEDGKWIRYVTAAWLVLLVFLASLLGPFGFLLIKPAKKISQFV